jgi:hypothetical protein
MRILLTLAACFGLALFASGAQHDDQNNNNNQQYKKKGGNAQVQQSVAPTGGNVYGKKAYKQQNLQQPGTVHYNTGNKANKNKWQGPVTGNTSNISGNAASSKFNKTNVNKNVNVNKNLNVNKNFKFQKKQFNLQTTNKQVVINKYKTVNYNANYKIAGAYKWKGNPKYQVFVNYHPQWHDTWWWNWHYGSHVVFIYGGWYYWDNYYWYPAWGYAPDSVYVVDAPIYASNPAEDPAQVVANVQSALQEQGYYQGDIDGVLGPQTRAALAEYQSAQGLEPTGLVDEPTLETLGMA